MSVAKLADPPRTTLYAWDISHTFTTLYHPYSHEPSALTEYLKQKLHKQRAQHQSCSHHAQVEQNIPLEHDIFCRMPISPNQLLKPSGTSNGSPHPNHHNQCLQHYHCQQPHSTTQWPSILSRMVCHLSMPMSWGCTPCGLPHLLTVHALW